MAESDYKPKAQTINLAITIIHYNYFLRKDSCICVCLWAVVWDFFFLHTRSTFNNLHGALFVTLCRMVYPIANCIIHNYINCITIQGNLPFYVLVCKNKQIYFQFGYILGYCIQVQPAPFLMSFQSLCKLV